MRACMLQASSANILVADEYLRDATTPEDVRDRFTEAIGDLLMTLPVVGVAGYLSGMGFIDAVIMFHFLCDL